MRELATLPESTHPQSTEERTLPLEARQPEVCLPADCCECPVCGKVIVRQDLSGHVEDCLNRQAIKALLRDDGGGDSGGGDAQQQSAKAKRKRPAAEQHPPTNKKQRRKVGNNTIDTYFKR